MRLHKQNWANTLLGLDQMAWRPNTLMLRWLPAGIIQV